MKNTKDRKNNALELPAPTIKRLPLYLSFLRSLKNNETKFISAPDIAKKLHIDSTQITKDFSFINVVGKTKVGYEKDNIIQVIEDFLGHHIARKAFIVGIGGLGKALINYDEFRNEGMEIIAGFDNQNFGTEINNIKIYNINVFNERFNETPIDIGIIVVPADQAQKVADTMISCDIKAIWNFSAAPISAPDKIIVENISIDSGLAMIKWKLNRNKPFIYKNRIL